jgi:catechol 2,3-dioxygenase-like lactoylglutathione lyase family enzyme
MGMEPVKLNAIGVVVENMARSLDFYRRLGFTFAEGAEKEEHVEAKIDEGVTLMFDLAAMVRGFDPAWSAPDGSPRVSFAFECGSPAAVDERYADLVAAGAGVRRPPWDAVWGMRYALLLDPDGNGIDLYAGLNPT